MDWGSIPRFLTAADLTQTQDPDFIASRIGAGSFVSVDFGGATEHFTAPSADCMWYRIKSKTRGSHFMSELEPNKYITYYKTKFSAITIIFSKMAEKE